MRRFIAVLFVSALASRGSAQTPEFDPRGYVPRQSLEKLEFGKAVRGLAIATHMPRLAVPADQPIWAYLVAKNLNDQPNGTDFVFGFATSKPGWTGNSCDIKLHRVDEPTKPVALRGGHFWMCGSRSLLELPARGYYVAVVDLGSLARLRPGEHELSWGASGAQPSSPVRFMVQRCGERVRPGDKPAEWQAWEISSGKRDSDRGPGEPEVWHDARASSLYMGELAAALGVGGGGLHVTNLDKIPARDDRLSVAADWEFGDKTDRVVLRFSANDPKAPVDLSSLHVYLLVLADQPDFRPIHDLAPSPMQGKPRIVAASHRVEILLPSNWRAQRKDAVPFQAALLVTSKEFEHVHRGERSELRAVRSVRKDAPPEWDGILKTPLQAILAR